MTYKKKERMSKKNKIVYESGFSFGALLAFGISFIVNKSIGWAIVAACFGWLYVIYAFFQGYFGIVNQYLSS